MPLEHHDHEYLGDGVYAAHDGYQIWLRIGAHTNAPVVALDEQVLTALHDYAIRIGLIPKEHA